MGCASLAQKNPPQGREKLIELAGSCSAPLFCRTNEKQLPPSVRFWGVRQSKGCLTAKRLALVPAWGAAMSSEITFQAAFGAEVLWLMVLLSVW